MTETDDLIRRLQFPISQMEGSDEEWIERVVKERNEAAYVIASQATTILFWQEQYDKWKKGHEEAVRELADQDSGLTAQQAEIERLRARNWELEHKEVSDFPTYEQVRREAIEDAAKVADAFAKGYVSIDRQVVCEALADAIRALARNEQ